MDTLRQDLSFALRSLRRTPGFTVAALATLAIGIGALTAMFSVVRSVLLEPLPYADPGRIVQIWSGTGNRAHGPTSSANYIDLRDQSKAFRSIAAEDFAWFNLTGDGAPADRRYGAVVAPAFFAAIGVQPTVGRSFTADDQRADPHVAVISHGLWQERFGGEQRAVGSIVRMNGDAYRVIGVMPAGFDFPSALIGEHVDLWTPLVWTPAEVQRGLRRLGITARLEPGVSIEQAQRDASAIAARLAAAFPAENKNVAFRVVPLQEEIVGSSQHLLLVLFGAVAMVLLIACANVANLTLARAQNRQKEIHLRAALGAGRTRIVRQLFTESIVLAAGGGVVGVLVAVWLTAAIVALGPEGLPRVGEISVDTPVLIFALGASTFAAVLFGLIPAIRMARGRPAEMLSASGRSTPHREQRRARSFIIVVEMALALVLLAGAGLLLRSFARLVSVNPGFDPRSVVTANVALSPTSYATPEQRRQFIDGTIARLAALPGADGAGAVNYLPFSRSDAFLAISLEGRSPTTGGDGPAAHIRVASPDYFSTMRIPVSAGRPFAAADRDGAPLVAIVNEALVKQYWPGENPIGRRIRVGNASSAPEWRTIIGVVGNVKHWALSDAAEPELYLALEQWPQRTLNFVVRAPNAPAIAASVRQAFTAVDKDQPVTIRLLDDLVTQSVGDPRFRSLLLGGFAAVALLLAIVGIYGVISYGVSQRTREIGVRLALGAENAEIVRLVVGEGIVLTLTGLALGLVGSFWMTRAIKGMLFQIAPTDALTFAATSLLLVLTATVASYLPARRAARVDPLIAMRAE